MSLEKDTAAENIAIAKMIANEVMDKVGKNAPMSFAFLWGSVKGYRKNYKVLLGASRSFNNWDEVISKIKEETNLVSNLYLNWD